LTDSDTGKHSSVRYVGAAGLMQTLEDQGTHFVFDSLQNGQPM